MTIDPLTRKIARVMAAASPTKTVTIKAGDHIIDLSGEALDALMDLAESRGLSLGEALAQAIALQKAIAQAKANGDKVIIERKDDTTRELVLA